jgi:hypothetical protein
VLALQDATDRIVASSPIGGSLSEAVTAEAFGGIAGAATAVESTPQAVETSDVPIAARGPVIAPAADRPSFEASHATTGTDAASAAAAARGSVDPTSSTSVSPAGSEYKQSQTDALGGPLLPAVQHVFGPHGGEEASPLGPTTPQNGFAPIDLTANLDDLLLDDDVDHEVTPPALDQPAHKAGAANVRAARPRTRGTGFFARVGRSIAHMLGTHTRSPGGTPPEPRRRRA